MVLYIVGIGPGSSDYITPAAATAVGNSETVFGSKRALELFPDVNEAVVLGAGDMDEKLEMAADLAVSGKVSVLSTGDPGFSGVLKPIKRIISEKKLDVEVQVIPGVSSVQLCAARLLIPWDEADIVTFHGRSEENIVDIIDNGRPTIILPSRTPSETARFLIENGVDPERCAAVCERLSYPDERVVKLKLREVAVSEFSYMSVIVVF
ncbi:cobalt-precorrin-7 (C(5))-methyltransferase [Methanothermobacter marburgensis]|uniref:Precorrin-6Y methylase n=1 Tax=Methanothermobacter marburgensis (strain ATCC BAA-927 / DSM 2133 / JCM 14651 / NBRC 100331 / OCM 82 / Marburg) TaxID=79929 RepID=D9PU11_METTM|nr:MULTISPECIES: cobalt-precorrin-7 (C(5))-methyltransferase [Methanothermobacter]ADL57709.1 precorrin-6Y methylase [Methanothermobacter marburgensis str. Marburg]WBF09936.1 cobalt-precorrin-7 (C(5))-methyltransferase [Methanothermobacter marburgensis]